MGTLTARFRWFAVALALLLVAGAAPLAAQSLADVARKEEARRKEVKEPAKVYTNKDLKSPPSASGSPTAADTDDKDKAAKDEKDAKTDKESKGDKDTEPAKDQAYWSGRMKDLQTALNRDQMFAEALQSRINALTTDFVNRDDPVQRAAIESDRNKALEELNRVKEQIETDHKAISDLEDEARRAGVPAGWLRS